METINEPARSVPVAADMDLCVVGGSCTGVFAAVAAARLGLSVAVVEANGFFGGVATAGLVNIWHATLDTAFQRPIIAGLTTEVVERLARRGAAVVYEPDAHRHAVLNTAELKIELDELVVEAGVRPFLHARFARAICEDGRAVAAMVEDKSSRRAIRAKAFIDATGDGDLIASMGLPRRRLPDLQPPTCCAHILGIDALAESDSGFDLAAAVFGKRDELDELDLPHGFLWASNVVGMPGLRMVAGTRVPDADCSDADQLTRAEIEGRRQVRAICDILRGHPGGEGVALAALPACIGIRETGHAECLHTLTEREVLDGVRFDDAIANGSYRVDVHHSDRPGLTFRYLDGREVYVAPGERRVEGRWRPETAESPVFYQVPYRSLVPRGAVNVLVAGRLIDADRGAYGAIRVMVNCNQTGQAAGAAAWLAIDRNTSVADVDPTALRQTLADQGAIVI
jgi:ribulose 1,5-bisphosphate synthetase/thiazole synthase